MKKNNNQIGNPYHDEDGKFTSNGNAAVPNSNKIKKSDLNFSQSKQSNNMLGYEESETNFTPEEMNKLNRALQRLSSYARWLYKNGNNNIDEEKLNKLTTPTADWDEDLAYELNREGLSFEEAGKLSEKFYKEMQKYKDNPSASPFAKSNKPGFTWEEFLDGEYKGEPIQDKLAKYGFSDK